MSLKKLLIFELNIELEKHVFFYLTSFLMILRSEILTESYLYSQLMINKILKNRRSRYFCYKRLNYNF